VKGTTATWYELDLTSYLKSKRSAGVAMVTIQLRNGVNTKAQTTLSSRETATGPQLVVTA